MQMKKSDMFDRWTILAMKRRIDDSAREEFRQYDEEAMAIIHGFCQRGHGRDIIPALMRLMEANAKTWSAESAIRDGATLPIDEVGRRALQIRAFNKLRVEAKQELDAVFGEIPDKKVEHASE